MELRPLTFNGNNIQQAGTLTSHLLDVPMMPEVDIISVSRTANAPSYGGKVIKGKNFKLSLNMLGTPVAQMDTVSSWFDTRQQALGAFVCKDINNSDKQWQIQATPIVPLKWQDQAAEVRMWTPDPVWKSVSQFAATITGSGTSLFGTVVVGGNVDAFPSFEVTGSSYPTGGFGYRRYVQFYNASPNPLINYPLNVVGTTLDTATLVAGTKLQADGDDFRVYVDGIEVYRWLDSWNSGTSKAWINIDSQPYTAFTVTAAIASGTAVPTSITAANTAANIKSLSRMPTTNGRLLVGPDEWTYGTLVRTTRKFTGLTRGVRNTAGTTAFAGGTSTIIWLEHDITVLYGDTNASAPDVDDTLKPIINLTTSTNNQFSWETFRDEAGLQSGIWTPSLIKTTGRLPGNTQGTATDWYTGNQGTTDIYPATDMGMLFNGYFFGVTPKAETAEIEWRFYSPCGGTLTHSSGQKYLSTLSSAWPARAALESSANGINWTVETNQAKPGTANTYQAWADGTQVIGISGGAYYFRFHFSGALSPLANVQAAYQVGGGTILFNSAKAPSISMRTEEQNYWLSANLANATTGESITVTYPLQLNQTLFIDTDARTVLYRGGSYLGAVDLQQEPARAEWLRLSAGTNILNWTTSSSGTIQIIARWYDRSNG